MKEKTISVLAMICLALYPILCYYVGPANFSYGQIIMMLFVILSVIRHGRNGFNYPNGFYVFWGYIAVTTLLLSMRPIDIIPGGVNFFVWALILGMSSRIYNETYLKEAMKYILLVSSAILVFQIFIYESTGTRICAILPLSTQLSYADLTYQEMVLHQTYSLGGRFSSLFMEPSYFAQYCLCYLVIEMFCSQNRDTLYSRMTVIGVITLLLLRSGVGLVGLAILVIIKIWRLHKTMSTSKFMVMMAFLIFVGGFALLNYMSSDYGSMIMERSEEFDSEDSSAYYRIVRGFVVYDALPFINKLFGISTDNLLSLNISALRNMTADGSMLYFNGFQTLLIRNGLIGVLIFVTILVKYAQRRDILTKVCLLLLLSIALMEQIYLMAPMLLLLTIGTGNEKNKIIK